MPSPKKKVTIPPGYEDIYKLKVWGIDDKSSENYNEGDVGLLAQGIRAYGFVGAIKVWKDYKVRGGNHSLLALRTVHKDGPQEEHDLTYPPKNIIEANDTWYVLTSPLDYLDETAANSFAIFDNRSAAAAAQNQEKLYQYLSESRAAETAIPLPTGYDDSDYSRLAKLIRQQGQTVVMDELTPDVDEAFDIFAGGSIKQIVMYFTNEQYVQVVDRLFSLTQTEKLKGNTEALVYLLDMYEAKNEH